MSLGFGNIARNDLARVFLFPNGVYKCGEEGQFANCLSVDALEHSRGDITKIECPSPIRYGEYDEVGSIPGELSRMTTTLSGRLSRTDISAFYQLFKKACSFDLHLHFGLCQQPNNFAQFDKAMVFEDVQVTNFSTDPLIALQSSDRAVINESIDISIGNFYEIVNLQYSQRAPLTTVAGPIVAVEVCDLASCGADCDNGSDGCQRMFAVTDDGVLYYSADGGITWSTIIIVDAGANQPTAVLDMVCWGESLVILDDANTLWYINRDDLFDGITTVFGTLLTAFAATGETATALATSLNMIGVIVGTGGHIALFTDLQGTTVLVDAGFTTTEDLLDVYIGANGTAVAVGENGAVIYSKDGVVWYLATPPAALDLTAVVVKSDKNWIVGTINGQLWCTDNSGRTWTRLSYPESATNTSPIEDLDLSTSHVLYMVTGTRLYRSIDGGASWLREPNSRNNLPTNTTLTTVAACYWNPNFVLVGGESVGGTGIIITGVAPSTENSLFPGGLNN